MDEDINIYDPNMVEFAVASRVDPINDIHIVDGFPGIPLGPTNFADGKTALDGRRQMVAGLY